MSNDGNRQKPSRRDLLKQATGVVVGLSASNAASATDSAATESESKFQPIAFWEKRMQPPDDGKRYGWFIDTRRCFGCHACEVSCKAENDVPLGNFIRQTIYKDVGEYPKVARMFLPMACQHCEDAPCLKACPCGAIYKEVGGTVAIHYEICCGHGTCVEVCPYGAIYLDPVAKQAVKCHNCYHRTDGEHGESMSPACATTCPSDAIYFGDLNDPNSRVSIAKREAEQANDVRQLRPEKKTKPRTWFRGSAPVEIEDRIPQEGESYGPEAYDIYNWKEKEPPIGPSIEPSGALPKDSTTEVRSDA